ncbi:MAG: hypothetical protein OEM59_05120 [Rhodospirillales bacterium]|nr:hypothetical protein [Rhodospirillales bacterium]
MPIWKLTPLDPRDPSWQASAHRAMAIVRAPDEEAAREAAEKAFGVKTGFALGGGIKAPPWKRTSLVKAERIKDDLYEPEGPTEVLEPTF